MLPQALTTGINNTLSTTNYEGAYSSDAFSFGIDFSFDFPLNHCAKEEAKSVD
jgi:hypothetical protein